MGPTIGDPYATLGIPRTASREEAARAHRRLAKRYHPDVSHDAAAADRMRRVNEAWRILSDPGRRARYDADRAVAAAGPWSSASHGYGRRATTATWTTWPDDRRAEPRARRPSRPEPIEPSFGDRRSVVIAVWAGLSLLFFLGSWLGSLQPR